MPHASRLGGSVGPNITALIDFDARPLPPSHLLLEPDWFLRIALQVALYYHFSRESRLLAAPYAFPGSWLLGFSHALPVGPIVILLISGRRGCSGAMGLWSRGGLVVP